MPVRAISTPTYITCEVCGKQFRVKPSRAAHRHTCSRKCRAEWEKVHYAGSGNPHFSNKLLTAICPICGKNFNYRVVKGRHKICCSFECANIRRSRVFVGANNHRWRGGAPDYYGTNWYIQRQKALARDGYTCQDCGITAERLGREPDVHHIKPFRKCANYLEANQLSNLVSLCHTCHIQHEDQSRSIYGGPDTQPSCVCPEDMLTPQDVADKLGVTIWAVYTRIRRGQIGAVNLNEGNLRERSRFLIPKSEVQTTAKPRYAKVTNEQRTLIRQMLDSGDYSLRRIAQQLDVTYAAVRKVAQE